MELVLIAIGLSMDAFAVALCKGLSMKKLHYPHAAIIALFFGAFQGVMPLIGWFLGKQFEQYVVSFGNLVAFVLLSYIGGRMIFDALHEKAEAAETASCEQRLNYKELFILAIATSIDALAIGISFAFLQTPIVPAVCLIATITFALSFVGVILGNRFGSANKTKAEIAGGVVLILIGIKALLEHFEIL